MKVFKYMSVFLASILFLMFPFMTGGTSKNDVLTCSLHVPELVGRWEKDVLRIASSFEVSEYKDLLLAIIAQESGGNAESYPDIMQSSESAGLPPNTFKTPEESMQQGIKYFAEIVARWKDKGFIDIKYAVQSYNFGIEFLDHAKEHGSEYFTEEVAVNFEKKQGGNYGDSNYVAHVYQYYVCTSNTNNSGMILPTGSNLMNERYGNVPPFGNIGARFHSGIDLQCSTGVESWSVLDGTVVEASYGWNGGFGNMAMVKHSDEITTLYAHFSELKVIPGQQVKQGQVLGLCGNTGMSGGAHLHFEVRQNGERVDPEPFLPPLERSGLVSP